MNLDQFDFQYPEELIALERSPQPRVMKVKLEAHDHWASSEVSKAQLLAEIQSGEVLVLNDTKVLKRRIFSTTGLEILFLKQRNEKTWEVLCPASRWKPNTLQIIGDGIELELLERGRPQVVRSHRALDDNFFEACGELPLPPYIQKARSERHQRSADNLQYQTAWAENPGSLAAPTASFHFSDVEVTALRARGVLVEYVTLHVGLGTFLPITENDINKHLMHREQIEISANTWQKIQAAKREGRRVWALGTTVARSLESASRKMLKVATDGTLTGESDLFLKPGEEFQVVDVLMTNFHQPRSTLIVLVAAFSGLEIVKRVYKEAIQKKFRLFSYGDLTVWMKR